MENVKAKEAVGVSDFNIRYASINMTGADIYILWTANGIVDPDCQYSYSVQIYKKGLSNQQWEILPIASGTKSFTFIGVNSGDVYDIMPLDNSINAAPNAFEYMLEWQAYCNDNEIANGSCPIVVNS